MSDEFSVGYEFTFVEYDPNSVTKIRVDEETFELLGQNKEDKKPITLWYVDHEEFTKKLYLFLKGIFENKEEYKL